MTVKLNEKNNKTYIEEKIDQANKSSDKAKSNYINALNNAESLEELYLTLYNYNCSNKRIKMLEDLINYQQYSDIMEMSDTELSEIKKRQIDKLMDEFNKCKTNLDKKLEELDIKEKNLENLKNNLNTENRELEIKKVTGLISLIKNTIPILQKKVITINSDLQVWKQYTLDEIKTRLLLEIDDYKKYSKSNTENDFDGSDELINKIVSNEENLKEFMASIRKYNDLVNKQNQLLEFPFNDSVFSSSYLKGNVFKHHIVNPEKTFSELEILQTKITTLLQIANKDNLQKLYDLFHDLDINKIDFEFIKQFNKDYPLLDFYSFNQKYNKKTLDNYLPKCLKKVRSKISESQQTSLHKDYQKILKDIFNKIIDEIEFTRIKIPSNLKESFDTNDQDKFDKEASKLETNLIEINNKIETMIKQTSDLIEFQEKQVKPYEESFTNLYSNLSDPMIFLKTFVFNEFKDELIIDKLVDIAIFNEEKQIKDELHRRSKIRSCVVDKRILSKDVDHSSPVLDQERSKIYVPKSHI